MKKSIKILIIAGVVVDVAITIFLFVISIIMLALVGKYHSAQEAASYTTGFFQFLFKNPTLYFWAFVFPLFILLAANIFGLMYYVKKTSAKEASTQLNDLSDEQKEALKAEILKDLMASSAGNEEPKENKDE